MGKEWKSFSRCLTFFPVSGRVGWFWQLPPLIFEECTASPISLDNFKESFWLRVANFDAFLVQLTVREILPRLTGSRHDRSKKQSQKQIKHFCTTNIVQDFLMMYFVIFFNSASVRLHNATYPLLLFYL